MTDYFITSMTDIIEELSLTVGLICVSDYADCIETVKTTPNLLGVVVIDWKPKKTIGKFYAELMRILDLISLSSEKNLTLSVIHRLQKSSLIFNSYKTDNIYLYQCHVATVTDEIIKLDGISPIIGESQGLFDVEESFSVNPSRVEFDHNYFNTVMFALTDKNHDISFEMLEKHQLLRDIQNFRNGDMGLQDLKDLVKNTPFNNILK